MNWQQLSETNRAEPHATSIEELDGLRGIVERNLADASIESLSADNRFGLAYEAALLLAKMAVACAGWRVKGPAQHATTFVALRLAMGERVGEFAAYFDHCRRKRNRLSYEYAGVASATEAREAIEVCARFREAVEQFVSTHGPN